MCTVVLNFVYHRIIYLHWFYFFVCLDRIKILNKFQFVELNGRLMWCDFGANLLQHFMRRYSRYSRYSRYQTVLLKLKEIITHLGLFRYKTALTSVGAVFCRSVSFWACRTFPSEIPSALCLTLLCSSTSLRSAQDDTTEKHEAKPSGISERFRRAVQFVKTLPSYLLFAVFMV